MPLHDYECRKCHKITEAIEPWDRRTRPCECGATADRTFLSQSARRHLTNPIVLHRHPDGTYGVPGVAGAPTPPGAERIEIRSMAEYNSVMKDWNSREKSKVDRGLERHLEAREQVQHFARQELVRELARTTDPLAKDLLRAALERKIDEPQSTFRPFINEAMEMNASNRDAWHGGETGHTRYK